MKNKINLIYKSFKIVLKKPSYLALTVVIAIIFFFINLWLANIGLIKLVYTSGYFDFQDKILTLIDPIDLVQSAFTFKSIIFTFILSLLLGINFSFYIYFLKRKILVNKSLGTSAIGVISGFLGIGCPACGSVILTTIFGLSLTTSLISFLPFNGTEFQILAILAIIFSIYLISKKIQDPLVCEKISK